MKPIVICLLMLNATYSADVVTVDPAGVTTITGATPGTAPATGEVKIGGGDVVVGRTTAAVGAQVVRGDDPRVVNSLSTALLGAINGIPTLGSDRRIPEAQLPMEARSFQTDFAGSSMSSDRVYKITGTANSIPGHAQYPFLRGIANVSFCAEGPWMTFSGEPLANEISFGFQCIMAFSWASDDKPEVDFGFHDVAADNSARPTNGAWFTRGATNTTVVAYTGNNGSLTANAIQFTPAQGAFYLFRIDFSQFSGARFRIWDDLSGVAAPVYDQTNTANLPAAKVRQWRPCVRHYPTTANTRIMYLAGMAHRIVRASEPVGFKW